MKYILLMTLTMLSCVFAQFENAETGWTYVQSTTQAFAQIEFITIDGEIAVGDGTGAQDGSAECLGTGLCDVVGAFIDRNDGNGEICVGWQYAGATFTTVPLNGNDGFVDGTELYMNAGDVAYFKVWDATNSSILDISLAGEGIAGWENFGFLQVLGTSTACNGGDIEDDCGMCSGSFGGHDANSDIDCAGECFGTSELDCTGECGGSADVDDCGECSGGTSDHEANSDKDCLGICFGLNVDTWCDDSCAETGPVYDGCGECGGDNSTCSGCMNSDANNYNEENLFDDGSCEYDVPAATNLEADPGPNRIELTWDAPDDSFTESSSPGYVYHIYQDGVSVDVTAQLSIFILDLEGQEYCFTILAVHNEYGDANSLSNQACATPEEVIGATWRLQLVAELDVYDQFENTGNPDWLIKDVYNYIGAAQDATWGYDHVHDILEPASPPGMGYISLYFDHPEWTDDDWNAHYTEDIVKDDHNFFSSNLTHWNARIESDVPGATTIKIHTETGTVPANYEMYLFLEDHNEGEHEGNEGRYHRISHEGTTEIEFYMDGTGQQNFSIFIGNIPPQAPANLSLDPGKQSINLGWDEDGDKYDEEDIQDIRNRYPATSFNVYRDDEALDIDGNECFYDSSGVIVSSIYAECLAQHQDYVDDPSGEDCFLSSGCGPGNGPGGCGIDEFDNLTGGGLLTGTFGQSTSAYFDSASIYAQYPGEGLLQESTYSYTVTGTNGAGESSYGNTIRMSGGAEEFFAGRDSRDTTTTLLNDNPNVVLKNVESNDGTNLEGEGYYQIPHNFSPDENRITISNDGSDSDDPDYPYHIDRWSWVQTGGNDDLQAISDTSVSDISFTVSNPHNNGVKSYQWSLTVYSDHPIKDSGACGEWTSILDTHTDVDSISVTIEEEPNKDPVASTSLGLIRVGDSLSVETSDEYDVSDFNDYDGHPGDPDNGVEPSGDQIWWEPHDNMGADNPADLWFSADQSNDDDGECQSSDDTNCDHQTYEWIVTSANDIGFDYEDLNGDGQYNYGEPFSLLGNEALIYSDIDLGDYYAAGGSSDALNNAPDNLVTCGACVSGEYGTSVDAATGLSLLNGENGAFGYNGRDAHISMHGGNDDSIIILTMLVTDIYGDTDQTSLIVAVDEERNVGPTTNALREQETYVISYGKDTRQTAVGGLDMDGNVCTADNLGAGDTDNDNLTFVWDYSYADAGTGGSELANFNENGADNSFYGHVQNGGPALNDNGWKDIAYDLAEGDHTFEITATDPYDESASSSTTIKVRREHDAPAAGVVVDHEDLKYTIVTVSEGFLGAQGADVCYGDVYDGDLDNTKTIELSNEENIIEIYRKQEDGSWVADDITAGEDAPLVQIDKSLAAETTYTYSVQSYNSDHATGLSDEGSSADATTGNRPTVEVLTPDGAEIRSIGDLYDVDFTTTDPNYISEIEVFYLHDDVWEAGVDDAGDVVSDSVSINVSGAALGNYTTHFQISDNDEINLPEISYTAKVMIEVHDVGDYDGANVESKVDDSDDPFTMADHLLTNDYLLGWHLVGPPLTPLESNLYNNFGASLGTWGAEWVAFNIAGQYDDLELNLSEGYYLALANNTTLDQVGDPVIGDPSCEGAKDGTACDDGSFELADIALAKGWNLISNPLVNKVSKEALTIEYNGEELRFNDAVDEGWIAPSIYGWFHNTYATIDRIVPFGGYFVNTSRVCTLKVRPHLFEDGELTRKVQLAETAIIELKARDISGEGNADFITVGLLENANDDFVYGEDEYDLPREAYTSMGGEYIDMKIGSDLMKDMKSTEYDDFKVWNISIETEKVDNDIELSWGDISGFEDAVYIVINSEAIDLREESSIEISTIINEIAIVVGNVDAYLNPIPEEFGLGAAYPNPFNPTTNLDLAMSEDGFVNMSVYNIRGQVVEVLIDRNMKAGYHNVVWNADGISSGMYFVRVETDSNTAIQKMMLLK